MFCGRRRRKRRGRTDEAISCHNEYPESMMEAKPKGISVYSLKHTWLEEVIQAGFEETTPKKEVEDLYDPVNLGISRRKGEHVICPRDGKIGAAYVDCLEGEDHVGPANLFVSYTDRYTIGDIVDTLYFYCEIKNLNPKSTYIWIFFCCMNLHREHDRVVQAIQVSTEEYLEGFLKSLTEIKNTLCLIYPWRKPHFLGISWCIIELFTATTIEDGTVDILMPPHQMEDMFQTFRNNFGDIEMISNLFLEWAKQAEASRTGYEEDQKVILKMISASGGLETVNAKANELMQKFVKDTFMRRTIEWIDDAEKRLLDEEPTPSRIADDNHSNCMSKNQLLREQSSSSNRMKDEDIPKGVSVNWLKTGLLEEVRQAGLSEISTIYDIENLKSSTFGVIRSKGEGIQCPRDGKLGAAYVDCLSGSDNVGPATVMLSYSWGNTIGDIVETLSTYCDDRGMDLKDTKVWICCLCNNQHRINKYVSSETFRVTFRNRVTTIGLIVALMSPWKNPVYLTRVWCVFELFTAYENGCQISIAMPPSERKDIIKYIGDIDALYKALVGGKVQNAKATFEEDRKLILQTVQERSGFDELNQVVNGMFRQWIKKTIMTELKLWYTLAKQRYHEEYVEGR